MSKIRARIQDDEGNIIYRKGDELFLALNSETRSRNLGTIIGDTIQMVRVPAKHLFRKKDAYGFNYNLLSRLNHVKIIDLLISKERFIIPIEDIIKNGSFLHFKQQGFETQIFFTNDQIEGYKATLKEKQPVT